MAELREIIEGCKRKDRRYQDELYRKYSAMLFGLCLRYTKSREEAEDVLQEGLVKIYKSIGSYSMSNSFEGWMRRIVINTAITHYRKNLKHAYHEDITEMSHNSVSTPDDFSNEFSREELLNVINKLPDGYRIVFNMYVVEGYKHKEISEILGIDINTSKSQLSRAKKYLQRELELLSKINL
ncbi:MAG: RNA polymerase sigma factor [Flavobacteriales bacterium]|nr:RNA polymerase sigma factor [Flavobacteriales bacterium]